MHSLYVRNQVCKCRREIMPALYLVLDYLVSIMPVLFGDYSESLAIVSYRVVQNV